MAHPLTIASGHAPIEFEDGWAPATAFFGKAFFKICLIDYREDDSDDSRSSLHGAEEYSRYLITRHEIVSGMNEGFHWDTDLDSSVVDFYVLKDDMLVVIMHDEDTNYITQHMVQLMRTERTEHNVHFRDEWIVHTICVRRKTVSGRAVARFVCAAVGMVHSGWLAVTAGTNWKRHNSEYAHLIAANPMEIDQYPDVDLISQIRKLAAMARRISMSLYTPMLTHKGLFFMLKQLTEQDISIYASAIVSTNVMGVVYFLGDNNYRTELVTLENGDVLCSNHFTDHSIMSNMQMKGIGYLVVRAPDMDVMKTWDWWWKKKRQFAKKTIFSLGVRLLTWLDSFDRQPTPTNSEDDLSAYRERIGRLTVPEKYYTFCIDLENLKFRKIPFEREVYDMEANPFCVASPNGDFFVCHHPPRDSRGPASSTLDVTLLWEPSNPPSLSDIAERVVMKTVPEYRKASYQRDLGLLRYGESVQEEESTDNMTTNPDTSSIDSYSDSGTVSGSDSLQRSLSSDTVSSRSHNEPRVDWSDGPSDLDMSSRSHYESHDDLGTVAATGDTGVAEHSTGKSDTVTCSETDSVSDGGQTESIHN